MPNFHFPSKSSLNLIASLIVFASAAAAQPVITQVLNGAGTSLKLCPGVQVIILGSDLGAFGAQSTILVGGQQAQITQNGSGEVFAVLPDTLSAGSTTITVTYNGQTSAPFTLNLVAYAPALAQINSTYIFPACQCYGTELNTQPFQISASSPALPGTVVGGLATGLGAVPIGTVTVTVAGQPVPLASPPQEDGTYAGLWDVLFTVPDLAAGAQPVVISIGGVSSPSYTLYVGVAAPSIAGIENSANGTLETASHGAAPNSILALYAYNAGTTTSTPSSYPTTTVEGIQVLVNGTPVPIYTMVPAANLINIQLPSELGTSGTASVQVNGPNGDSSSFTIALAPADVGLYRLPATGYANNGAIEIDGTAWLVAPAAVASAYNLPACTGLNPSQSCAQPAPPGANIVLYWTGGGPTTPTIPTGQVAPADGSILVHTLQLPSVTIGGITANVSFSGVVPGYAGFYQLNITIPLNAPTGDQVPLVVTSGASSDTVGLAIQAN